MARPYEGKKQRGAFGAWRANPVGRRRRSPNRLDRVDTRQMAPPALEITARVWRSSLLHLLHHEPQNTANKNDPLSRSIFSRAPQPNVEERPPASGARGSGGGPEGAMVTLWKLLQVRRPPSFSSENERERARARSPSSQRGSVFRAKKKPTRLSPPAFLTNTHTKTRPAFSCPTAWPSSTTSASWKSVSLSFPSAAVFGGERRFSSFARSKPVVPSSAAISLSRTPTPPPIQNQTTKTNQTAGASRRCTSRATRSRRR